MPIYGKFSSYNQSHHYNFDLLWYVSKNLFKNVLSQANNFLMSNSKRSFILENDLTILQSFNEFIFLRYLFPK